MPYLITGEYYYLEELYFWGAADVAASGSSCWIYGRCGSWGIIHEGSVQFRGMAWAIRNLANAAFLSPDGTPEAVYLTQKVNYNLAVKEGQYNITNGTFYDPSANSPWTTGRTTFGGGYANPLRIPAFFDPTVSTISPNQSDAGKVWFNTAPWMTSMWMMIVGHLPELGYPAGPVKQFVGQHIINILQNPAYDPYMIASYTYPSIRLSDHLYFDTWSALLAADLPSYITSNATNQFPYDVASPNDADFGYVVIGRAAASFLPGLSDGSLTGQNAWNWLNSTIPVSNANLLFGNMNDNPKWALVPRGSVSGTPPPPPPLWSLITVTSMAIKSSMRRTYRRQST